MSPSIAALMGVDAPETSGCPPSRRILDAAAGAMPVERMLVFAPDAVGSVQTRCFPAARQALAAMTTVSVSLRSVMPPKTPVCFASMFTGAGPGVHGIRRYEKPVLGCDTIFDALARAGRRVAIVAVRESSIDLIFRDRPIDYFSEPDDRSVTGTALSLMESDSHDFILAYQQGYDDLLHTGNPFGPDARKAVTGHLEAFEALAAGSDVFWRGFNRASAFAPDHGAHLDPGSGRGDHGLDCAEDMEVEHFWRIRSAGSHRGSGIIPRGRG